MPARRCWFPRTLRLVGETFQQLLTAAGNGADKPILDTVALAEVDMLPGSLVPAGANWESLGLVVVSATVGNVLTTPRQLSIWRTDASAAGTMPPTIRSAIEDASRFGRDASGRFRRIDDWLEPAIAANNSLLAKLGGDEPGWTTWEVRNPNADNRLTIVRTSRHCDCRLGRSGSARHCSAFGRWVVLAVGEFSFCCSGCWPREVLRLFCRHR